MMAAALPLAGDVAIQGEAIAVVGSLGDERGRTEIDATGLVHVAKVVIAFATCLLKTFATVLGDGWAD